MRAWICGAAIALFDKHGYHGVTRDQIAATVGCSIATLHNHFPTKQSLAVAAYAPPILGLMHCVEESLANGMQVDDAITDFIRRLAVGLHSHPTMAYALLPLAADQRAAAPVNGVERSQDLSFWQVVAFFGGLLEQRETTHKSAAAAVDVADLYLSGLLAWIVQHPDRSGEDAATLVLAQLL